MAGRDRLAVSQDFSVLAATEGGGERVSHRLMSLIACLSCLNIIIFLDCNWFYSNMSGHSSFCNEVRRFFLVIACAV